MLRVDRLFAPVTGLGPGRRIALWTVGCRKRCPGCISPSLQDDHAGAPRSVEEVFHAISSLGTRFDGLTVTGGEPFLQSQALAALCRRIRQETTLDILVYSGYRFEPLRRSRPARDLLEVIDLLVDGEFRRDLPSASRWWGSENQRLIVTNPAIRDRYPDLDRLAKEGPRTMELCVARDGAIYMAGIPRPGDLERLLRQSKEHGVSWIYE